MNKFFFIYLFFPFVCVSQISFSEENIDLGYISEAYDIEGDVVLTNASARKIFLMRADADKGVKIYTSKKMLLPGDTCLLVISFIPENNGKFKKKIQLVSSDRGAPYELNLSGTLANVKTNDRMACVYFGKRKDNSVAVKNEPIIVPANTTKKDNSNKLPGSSEPPVVKAIAKQKAIPENDPNDFSELNYRPNNILFLVDISSSMRDSLKLPVMKTALHKLIDAVRKIDTITFVTYASRVKVMKEAASGADKKTLHTIVDSLHAKGMTSGKTAILFSQLLAQRHYIKNGNNQIIIATDGEFKFEREDFAKWKERQLNKKIILSTVAFGQEKTALKNLKEIAYKGEGSFIHIDQKNGSEEKLLDEIKLRSRK
jgi:Mg-chelatase subunit ChlD